MSNSPIFVEKQSLRSNMLLWLILPGVALVWTLFALQTLLRIPINGQVIPWWFLVPIWLLVGMLLPSLTLFGAMQVRVYQEKVAVAYAWFKTEIPIQKIESVKARLSEPLSEYGGWGIRKNAHHGTSYTVSGNTGVQLTLKSGQTVFIGSRRFEELSRTIGGLL